MEDYYTSKLQTIKFNGDICDYLNITTTTKSDVENLTSKFNALDSMGLNSAISWLFLPMIHQLVVAKCAFMFKKQQIMSNYYRDNVLIYFTKYGYYSLITPYIIVPNMIVLVSMFSNISLIVVTVSKLKDRKTCNWLLAFDSLCQILVVFPFLINLAAVLYDSNSVDYHICLGTLTISTISSFASFMSIYLISLERLMIVIEPLKMNRWSSNKSMVFKFLMGEILFCVCFGIVMKENVFNVWTIINMPFQKKLYCNVGLYSDVLNTPLISYIVLLLSALNYMLIFALLLWRHLKSRIGAKKQQNISSDHSSRRMLRSVFILLTVVLIGWLVASATRNKITDFIGIYVPLFVTAVFAPTNDLDRGRIANNINVWLISFITCVPLIASASGPIILIFNSTEYRDAYKLFIRRKASPIGHFFSNQIAPSSIKNGF